MVYHQRTTCRACAGTGLHRFLELGPQPLANSFLRNQAEFTAEAKYPLDVYYCADCSLVQLLDVIDPAVLFRNYIYVTGTSETIAAHNVAYARSVVEVLGLQPHDLVVEIASNDGSLLKRFRDAGVRTLGVEPASNIAAIAREDGIDTVDWFFTAEAAVKLRAQYGPARAIIGNNVLAHVDDTRDFLRGCRTLLADDGLVVIEVPYLLEFIDRLEYDTVYHEHLCYFAITPLLRLAEAAGLSIVRVDRVPVHGGSIRIYAGPVERHRNHGAAVLTMAARERAAGLTSLARYERFAVDVARNREAIRALLQSLKTQGKSLAAYGAPAKGNTLLNYCQLTTEWLPYTVDRSPHKIGMFTPGMHLPVLPTEALQANRPDLTLILAWNFAEEIMRQQRAYSDQGGRFILPLPTPRVV